MKPQSFTHFGTVTITVQDDNGRTLSQHTFAGTRAEREKWRETEGAKLASLAPGKRQFVNYRARRDTPKEERKLVKKARKMTERDTERDTAQRHLYAAAIRDATTEYKRDLDRVIARQAELWSFEAF